MKKTYAPLSVGLFLMSIISAGSLFFSSSTHASINQTTEGLLNTQLKGELTYERTANALGKEISLGTVKIPLSLVIEKITPEQKSSKNQNSDHKNSTIEGTAYVDNESWRFSGSIRGDQIEIIEEHSVLGGFFSGYTTLKGTLDQNELEGYNIFGTWEKNGQEGEFLLTQFQH